MYNSSRSERQLYSNIPRYQMDGVCAFPGGFNRRVITEMDPKHGRQYKMFINKSDVNTSNDLNMSEIDNDTYNRLVAEHDSFDNLPQSVENIERYTHDVHAVNLFGTSRNRNVSNFIDNTRERFDGAGRLNNNMQLMLEGDGSTKSVITPGNRSNNTVQQFGRVKRVANRPRQTDTFVADPKRNNVNTASARTVEKYTYAESNTEADTDEMFMNMLKSRAKMLSEHVMSNKFYRKWIENWKLLDHNLKRTKYLFNRLDQSDADIAYVINKGDEVNFRIRDEIRYVPINIYQYVLYHEMAHMSTTELQHTPKFHELLNILSFAAFELGLIDLRRTTKEYWNTNGQPILCRAALADEIIAGADWLSAANRGHEEYFDNIVQTVINMSD